MNNKNKLQSSKAKRNIKFKILNPKFESLILGFRCSFDFGILKFGVILFVVLLSGNSLSLPNKVFFNVPFAPQAPYGVWDNTYNEACEEISIIMAMRWAENKGLTRLEADKEIKELVKFQEKNYGGHFDLNAAQTAKLMEEFYGYKKYEVVLNASIETIVDALSKKEIVLVPMAGRLLGNPYYKKPGPVYHMMVVKGYDLVAKELITNDGGTKRGNNYRYKFDVFNNAWHDWAGSLDNIIKGKKNLIIINK